MSRSSRYSPRLGTGYSGTQTETLTPADYRPSSQSNVLWRFNETNTSQIGTRVVPCTLNASPVSSETISVDSSVTNVGSRLRFQLTFSTNSVTTNAGLWPLLNDSGAAFTLPDRFIVRIKYRTLTLSNVSLLYCGFGLWNNSTSTPYGIGLAQSSSGTNNGVVRLQSSDGASATRPWAVMNSTGAGGGWVSATNIDSPGAAYQIKFDCRQGTGGNPFVGNAQYESISGAGTSTATPFTSIPAARSAAGSAFQSLTTTIDAGFNDQACNYPCLFFIASTGTGTKTADFSISDFAILTDPMDYA